MANPKAEIDADNQKILENPPLSKTKSSNCLKKKILIRVACPHENALYYTKISCEDEKYEQELYKRFFKTLFKKR